MPPGRKSLGRCSPAWWPIRQKRESDGAAFSQEDNHRKKDSDLVSRMKIFSIGFVFGALWGLLGSIVEAAAQESNQLTPVPIQSVTVEDSFWSPKRAVWQAVTI